ncbi:DUF5786 family protein [Halomarina pelagica]|uniref:DUF5786 family protein n=1 Tax=Halomarina pelagica TaxID=2961599 RepID=UPI0020C32BC4|nr:DUF5786 family protein [Halomarina sp. BND7]
MGFGSYDESEQDRQQLDTDLDDDENLSARGSHEGKMRFEFGASNDELLDRLEEMKERE